MYHRYVCRRLRKGFGRLNREQFEAMLREFPAGFTLYFPGFPDPDGPLYDLEQTIRLYGRIFAACPDLRFEVRDVLAGGGPGFTRVAVHWTGRTAYLPGPAGFSLPGVHIFHIRWGKVIRLEIFTDTGQIREACRALSHRSGSGKFTTP